MTTKRPTLEDYLRFHQQPGQPSTHRILAEVDDDGVVFKLCPEAKFYDEDVTFDFKVEGNQLQCELWPESWELVDKS